MINKNTIKLITIGTGILLLGLSSFAQADDHRPRKKPMNWVKQLDLDVEQVRMIDEHREHEKKHIKSIRKDLREKQEQLRMELAKPNSNPARVDALMAEISALKEKAFKSRINSIQTMKKILKPEQQHYLEEHIMHKMPPKKRNRKRNQRDGGAF